jgi:hypothetical protein
MLPLRTAGGWDGLQLSAAAREGDDEVHIPGIEHCGRPLEIRVGMQIELANTHQAWGEVARDTGLDPGLGSGLGGGGGVQVEPVLENESPNPEPQQGRLPVPEREQSDSCAHARS